MDAYLDAYQAQQDRDHAIYEQRPYTLEDRLRMLEADWKDERRDSLDLWEYEQAFGTASEWAQEMAGEAEYVPF